MNTTTPPSGPESPEIDKKEKTGKSIESLIQKVTTGKNNGFDPYIRNKLDESVDARNKMLKEVREGMRAGFSEEEYGFQKDAIDTLTDGELRGYLEKYSRSLVSLRRKTPKVIKRYFPNAIIDEATLNDDISQYSEDELSRILEGSATIKKYLRESLNIDIAQLNIWKPRLRELFEPENMPEGDLRNRLTKAIERFEESNVPLDRDLIRELVGYYDQDHERIEKIAKEFHITFSLRDAISSGMISSEDVDAFTENLYSEIWTGLSDEQKNQFRVEVRKDDFSQFSFDELKAIRANFSNNYSAKKFKDTLAATMNSRFGEFISDSDRPMITTSFSEFVDKIKDARGRGKSSINIYPIDNLGEGSVMVCRERSGKIRFLKIEKIDEELSVKDGVAGMALSFLDGVNEGTIGQAKGRSTVSYESIEQLLGQMMDIQVMDEDELRSQIDAGMWKDEYGQTIRDKSEEEDENSFEFLANKLDSVDVEGKTIADKAEIAIKAGMVFLSKVDITDKKGKVSKKVQSFTVLKVDMENKMIYFSNGRDAEQATFYEFAKSVEDASGFQRIAILNSDSDFISAIGGMIDDFPSRVHIKDGKFVPEHHEDDGHDGGDHGHDGHGKDPTIEYFRTGEGDGHIRMFEVGSEFVSFGEYDPPSNVDLEKIRQAKGAKKLSKSKEKGFYSLRTMTRAQFLVYLKENKLKATTEDLLDPHAGYHPHDPHMHGGGIMGLFKGPSFNDIFKGFSNIAHGIEHYFEKNSKLNASRFALGVGRKFGFPVDIMAQLQADEVSSMKEIIEKIQEKLFNLNGPVARKKALHIAELTSSSAEEVGAAMLYMVKGYGHLYAEDIAHAQGSETFINGFLSALGWKGAELTQMKRDARAKYLGDLGSGGDGTDVTEEEMIWGVLKIIDGGAGRDKNDPKYDPRYANAGAVVKAMGGPSGWEKAWRTEGIKNAYEKGIRQGGDVVNAQGRVNKGISALKTFELNTAIGFMEKAAGKSPDPSIQTIPVLWALGGYSKHCSTAMKQSVKGYGDSKGHTFHAYAFLRNFEDNETYTRTFIKALRDIDSVAADKASNAINTIRLGPLNNNKKTKDAYEKAIDDLADIWKKYQDNGLHDHLQGKSTWIMKKINEDDHDVKKYAKRFADIHKMNSNETPPGNDNDWDLQYGVNGSGIFGDNKGGATKEQDGKQVLSIAGTLNKLRINGYEFEKNAYDRLWPVVRGHFQKLESESDPVLKKAQYKQFREDVLYHFRNRMDIRAGGKESAIAQIVRKDYYKDLLYMGIDPNEIFDNTPYHIMADKGYDKWVNGSGKHSHGTKTVGDLVAQLTSKTIGQNRDGFGGAGIQG